MMLSPEKYRESWNGICMPKKLRVKKTLHGSCGKRRASEPVPLRWMAECKGAARHGFFPSNLATHFVLISESAHPVPSQNAVLDKVLRCLRAPGLLKFFSRSPFSCEIKFEILIIHHSSFIGNWTDELHFKENLHRAKLQGFIKLALIDYNKFINIYGWKQPKHWAAWFLIKKIIDCESHKYLHHVKYPPVKWVNEQIQHSFSRQKKIVHDRKLHEANTVLIPEPPSQQPPLLRQNADA